MNKLQLNELAAYFPYGLKAYFKEKNTKSCRKMVVGTVGGIYSNCSIVCHDTVNATPDKFFPILRPLSDFENSGFDIQDEILVDKLIHGNSIDSMPSYLIKSLVEKTTLVNLQNGAKITLPVGTSIMARVIVLPDGTTVCTAFHMVGNDRCYVLTRTIRSGVQIPNFKIKNESEEIIKDKDDSAF